MRPKKYPVRLTEAEVSQLTSLLSKGKSGMRTLRRAGILLQLDENRNSGVTVKQVMKSMRTNGKTVHSVARQYRLEGLHQALNPKRSGVRSATVKIVETVQAQIEDIARSAPPEGRSRWTLQMIRDRLIAMRVVDSISTEGVRQALKKRLSVSPKQAAVLTTKRL